MKSKQARTTLEKPNPLKLVGYRNGLQKVTGNTSLTETELRLSRASKLQLRREFPVGCELSEDERLRLVDILYGPEVTQQRWDEMNRSEQIAFRDLCQKGLNILCYDDIQRLIDQVGHLWDNDTRRSIWEGNHTKIIIAIEKLTKQYCRFPSRGEISRHAELSRATVNKHLKEYFPGKEYLERKEEYILMREIVLGIVFKYASEGDIKACKAFLEATNVVSEAPRIQNQQNYVQVNGLVITEAQLNGLPPDKLQVLKDIVEAAK